MDATHLAKNVSSILEYVCGEAWPVDYSQVRKVEWAGRVFVYDSQPTVKRPSQNAQQFSDAHASAPKEALGDHSSG